MPFGIIGRTGPGIRQVVGFGDRSAGMVLLGANLGRAIVTNGDFTDFTVEAAVWGDACGGPRNWCIRWGPHRAREGEVLGGFLPHFHKGECH